MKTGRMLRGTYLAFVVSGLLALGLAGCNTGDTGPTGPAGPPGQTTVVGTSATSLTLKITGVTVGHQSTVNFTAVDQNGTPFAGIPQGDIELTIAELIPGTDGNDDHWQNYISQERQAVASGAPMTEAPQPQAISGADGTLVNHQDGSYTFTFGGQGSPYDVTDITTPVKVSYDPGLTQRVALTLRTPHGSDPTSPLNFTNNAIYTWQPSTGATTGIDEKKMVSTATCDSCHGELDLHGGPRHDVAMCVTCHNQGNTDPNTGYTLAFNSMIHRIHAGSVLAAGTPSFDFLVYGYMNNVTNFNDVVFPQNIENCSRCHDPSTADVPNAPWTSTAEYQSQYPDWDRYETRPTIAACESCHVNLDITSSSTSHPGGQQLDNSNCTTCHNSNTTIPGPVAASHLKSVSEQKQLLAKDYEFKIVSVTNTSPGQYPQVTYEVLNPNTGTPYDVTTNPGFSAANSAGLNVDIGWSTTLTGGYSKVAYTNLGAHPSPSSSDAGEAPAQPIHFSALPGNNGFTDNNDGTYTVTSPTPIPDGTNAPAAVGSGVVALEGYVAADLNNDGTYGHDERIPVTSVAQGIPITTAPPANADLTPQTMVDIKKCQVCHGHNDGLAMHGGNRNDNLQVCVICHNPRDTDVSFRPVDNNLIADGTNSAAVDGLEQRPIDFKYMIHAIHGAAKRGSDAFVVYGYGGGPNDFSDVQFPNPKLSCNICHVNNSYQPPLPASALPTTVQTGVAVYTRSSSYPYGATEYVDSSGAHPAYSQAFDQTLDTVITPTASACSACHTSTTARAHMQTNGGQFDVSIGTAQATAVEACAVCHGSGRLEDVAKVHDVH